MIVAYAKRKVESHAPRIRQNLSYHFFALLVKENQAALRKSRTNFCKTVRQALRTMESAPIHFVAVQKNVPACLRTPAQKILSYAPDPHMHLSAK